MITTWLEPALVVSWMASRTWRSWRRRGPATRLWRFVERIAQTSSCSTTACPIWTVSRPRDRLSSSGAARASSSSPFGARVDVLHVWSPPQDLTRLMEDWTVASGRGRRLALAEVVRTEAGRQLEDCWRSRPDGLALGLIRGRSHRDRRFGSSLPPPRRRPTAAGFPRRYPPAARPGTGNGAPPCGGWPR